MSKVYILIETDYNDKETIEGVSLSGVKAVKWVTEFGIIQGNGDVYSHGYTSSQQKQYFYYNGHRSVKIMEAI